MTSKNYWFVFRDGTPSKMILGDDLTYLHDENRIMVWREQHLVFFTFKELIEYVEILPCAEPVLPE